MVQSGNDKWEEWSKEFQRLEAELRPYLKRISAKWTWNFQWKIAPTEQEVTLERLYYFYQAALINAGDVFGYVSFMIENKRALAAVGAKGCLAALERLMPLHEEYQKLATEQEQGEYLSKTKTLRENAEALAEDSLEFGRLLLAYSQKNASKIGPK